MLRAITALTLLGAAAALLVPAPAPESAVTWEDLIAPHGIGQPLARGYVVSPPRRGEDHDVVFVARLASSENTPAGRVEIHVVDRGHWTGVPETQSFGVAWEVPPAGSSIVTTPEESSAVTLALFEAIAANDTGFASVDSVPLVNEPVTPTIARVVERLGGMRGAVIATLVSLALILLTSLRGGNMVAAALLFAVSLGLRAPALDLPFAHDQDVQRMLTGNSSPVNIATGVGLQDRHPPLYFFVLHMAQWFGQSEAIGRAPAVVAGSLAAPGVFLAARAMIGCASAPAVIAALAVAVSPQLIARSREVSGIPLYALFLIAAAGSLVAAARRPTTMRRLTLGISHTLSLFTYYLAPFVVVAHIVALLWRRPDRATTRSFIIGLVAGLPALMLGVATLLRDWTARDVARAFPTIAWGEHDPLQMGSEMVGIATEAFGLGLVCATLLATIIGVLRRNFATIVPMLGVLATFAAVALLSPIARVQSYYFTSALPLAALALAVAPASTGRAFERAWTGLLIVGLAFGTVPLAATSRPTYLPDTDAFMPRFAATIMERPERTVVTIAHYDKTLLAYYLARLNQREIRWRNWEDSAKPIIPLVKVHSLRLGSEAQLVADFDEIVADGPVLVIERDAVTLPAIQARLSSCESLLEAPTGRLKLCRG